MRSRRSRSLTSLALGIGLFTAFATTSVAGAAERFEGQPSAHVASLSSPEAKARAYFDEHRIDMATSSVELGSSKVIPLGDERVVRFEQTVSGVPVVDASIIVRIGRSGAVRTVVLSAARDLSVDVVPSFDQDAAFGALESALANVPFTQGRNLPTPESATLVVKAEGTGRLLWQLDVRDTLGGTRYFVDAHTGELAGFRSMALDAKGRVYEVNSVDTPLPVDLELDTLDTVTQPARLNGWAGLLAVTNYLSGAADSPVVTQDLGPSSGSDFLYDPPASSTDKTDAFAQVNLFFHLTTMRNFFSALGVDQTAQSWKLTAIANALDSGKLLDNAFFSPMGIKGAFPAPNLIAIGQGTKNDFAYDSDVFKHEFGHYVTDNTVGYNQGQTFTNEFGLSPFSGAVDEGIADYFACSQNNDAELGEASLEPLGALRDLTDTGKVCPDDVLGEVHEDGEIIGSMSWSIREKVGAAAADKIVWGAIAEMPKGGNFGDFGRGLISTANALVDDGTLTAADLMAIQDVIHARGLDDCDPVLEVKADGSRKVLVLGLDLIGQLLGGGCADAQQFGVVFPSLFHFKVKPGATDKAVRLKLDIQAVGGDVQTVVYARKGEHVTFNASGLLPEVDKFDVQVPVNAKTGEIVIDESSTPPFDPSAEYFFALTSTSCPTLNLTVTTDATPSMPTTTTTNGVGGGDTGGSSGDGGSSTTSGTSKPTDEDDGCGCAIVGEPSSSSRWFGLAFGALALGGAALRRRRSQR